MSHGPCNKTCVVPMSSVIIAAVEDTEGIVILCRQARKKSDEADFIVDLG